MKIINLSKKKFQELEKLNLSREIFNLEGIIYDFNYRGNPKILKTLYHLSGPIFANKLYTLEMLDSNKEYLPSNFYIPDSLCTVDSKVIGFTVPKIEGTTLSTILGSKEVSYKEQIYYLKKIGEILNQLHYIRKNTPLKDIYINDLHDSNFIVDNKNRELKVIDLDSCKIGDNKSFASRFLTPASIINGIEKYKLNKDMNSNGHMIADSNTDLYCYCITILNYLYGYRIESIGSIGIEKYFEYLNYLDSLTGEQICRAKKLVYDKSKNKIRNR